MDLTSRSIIFFSAVLQSWFLSIVKFLLNSYSLILSSNAIFTNLSIFPIFFLKTYIIIARSINRKCWICCYVCCSFLIIQTAHDTAQFSYYQLFYEWRCRLDYYNVTGGGQQDQPPSLGSASSRGSDWKLTWSWRWSILVSWGATDNIDICISSIKEQYF